jgi:outer membrane protein insertion porin family
MAQGQSPAELTPYLDKPIARVEILYGGAPLTPAESQIEGLVGIRAEELFSVRKVRAAVLRLYQSGQASNVVVTAEGPPSECTLRFEISPLPEVGQVIFEGVQPPDEEALHRRLALIEPGSRLTPERLNRAAEDVVEYLHDQGYFEAEAVPSTTLEAGGRRAIVRFRVSPGARFAIDSISLEGDIRIDQTAARAQFVSDPGDPYRAAALQQDLQMLRRLHIEQGYAAPTFGQVTIVPDPEKKTVNLTIPVSSGPRVELRVEGAGLSEKRKKELLPTLDVGGVDPATLEEGRLKLLDYLQRQGHFFAEVSVETKAETAERVEIVYQVDPGREYQLQAIQFRGTEAVSFEDVAKDLGSKLGGFLSRGLTSRELLDLDRRVITEYLRSRGYLKARVTETLDAVKLNRKGLVITHVVEAGAASRVAGINLQGHQAFSRDELIQQLRLKEGQTFVQSQVTEDAGRLAAFYSSQGYAEAEVVPRLEEVNEQAIQVTFEIKEGQQLKVNRVRISGNQATHPAAIVKYLALKPGDLLVNERLAESEQNLYSTSGFRRVSITKEPAGVGPESAGRRNVHVQVAEVPRFVMTYGFGYRTDDGPRGLYEVSNTNLWGRLYTGSFRVRASRREQLGQLSFTNPRPYGKKFPALLSTFFQREERAGFDASRLTMIAQVERELKPSSLLVFRYNFSNIIISNVTRPGELRREDSTVQIGRLSATFVRDTRNSVFDPTQGTFTSADVSLASYVLGGNENFFRFFGEHQRYYRIPKLPSTVFAADVRLGLANPFGQSDTIPISERFFAGGATTLRGFSFEAAGPRGPDPDPDRVGQTKPLGGNALAIFNTELRFPIWQRFRLGGAAFYDTGNVFGRISDFKLQDFTHTVGFGFRINTPVGPVRVDFGALVRREPLVPRTRIHVSFGPPF